ncbi:MAG: hypothetical protein V5A20_01975 [Salinibacter sp.]|jgi:hypothetical protein|uniref:hypothetical protein n=1 Tax=Salinibacter sp. TaxID=2065818 RepID=UPI002FC2D30B
MNDRLPSLSVEARERHPYRSLYAALLLQSFQDAVSDALTEDSSGSDDGAAALSETPASAVSQPSMRRA